MKQVIVAGSTGYLGRPLIEKLCQRGYRVKAIARPQSIAKVPPGCEVIIGNVLDRWTYQEQVPFESTFVHLVGVAHPAPWKASQFRSIDLVALEQSAAAAKQARVSHFVFVSVAHPAPAMKAYVQVRMKCEAILHESGLNVTILRPWYILGPGHRWPVVLIPFYRLLERFPATKSGAQRLGLVTREEMLTALLRAVEMPSRGVRIEDVSRIRGAAMESASA